MIMVPPPSPFPNAPHNLSKQFADPSMWSANNNRDLQSPSSRLLDDTISGSIRERTAAQRAASTGNYLDYQRSLSLDVLPRYSSDLSRLLRMESMQRLQQSQRMPDLGPFDQRLAGQLPNQLASHQRQNPLPSQLSPHQLQNQLPPQLPSQLPSQMQSQLPSQLPSHQLPNQLPSHQLPSHQLPSHQLPNQLPSQWLQNVIANQSMQSPSLMQQQAVARASAASMTTNGLDLLRSAASQDHMPGALPFARADVAALKNDMAAAEQAAKPKDGHFFIDDIREWDVLCGRGGRSNHHPGNKRYRQVVSEMKASYRNIEAKSAKTDLSRAIVEHVYNYGGRFVKMDKESGRYYVLTVAESRKKTSQALRETKELKWTL